MLLSCYSFQEVHGGIPHSLLPFDPYTDLVREVSWGIVTVLEYHVGLEDFNLHFLVLIWHFNHYTPCAVLGGLYHYSEL